jgi:hypothetical protein
LKELAKSVEFNSIIVPSIKFVIFKAMTEPTLSSLIHYINSVNVDRDPVLKDLVEKTTNVTKSWISSPKYSWNKDAAFGDVIDLVTYVQKKSTIVDNLESSFATFKQLFDVHVHEMRRNGSGIKYPSNSANNMSNSISNFYQPSNPHQNCSPMSTSNRSHSQEPDLKISSTVPEPFIAGDNVKMQITCRTYNYISPSVFVNGSPQPVEKIANGLYQFSVSSLMEETKLITVTLTNRGTTIQQVKKEISFVLGEVSPDHCTISNIPSGLTISSSLDLTVGLANKFGISIRNRPLSATLQNKVCPVTMKEAVYHVNVELTEPISSTLKLETEGKIIKEVPIEVKKKPLKMLLKSNGAIVKDLGEQLRRRMERRGVKITFAEDTNVDVVLHLKTSSGSFLKKETGNELGNHPSTICILCVSSYIDQCTPMLKWGSQFPEFPSGINMGLENERRLLVYLQTSEGCLEKSIFQDKNEEQLNTLCGLLEII